MSGIPRWFDRKFEFSFPADQYPILCARLRGTPARLDEVMRGSTRDVLVWKPLEKWSAQEHAGHLLDVEPTFAQRFRIAPDALLQLYLAGFVQYAVPAVAISQIQSNG